MIKLHHMVVVCAGWLLALISSTSQATLIGVLPATSGGSDYQAYWDSDTNLTWLADASASGPMTWTDANNWATSLDIKGVKGWRLPTTNPVNGSTYTVGATEAYNGSADWGYNISAPSTPYAGSMASEMAYLFYNTLNNQSACDPAVSDHCATQTAGTNAGPFSNIQVSSDVTSRYWSASVFPLTYPTYCTDTTTCAWFFLFKNGAQGFDDKTNTRYAWAVHTGNAGAVPLPAAVWLFGGGLLGLIGVARPPRRSSELPVI